MSTALAIRHFRLESCQLSFFSEERESRHPTEGLLTGIIQKLLDSLPNHMCLSTQRIVITTYLCCPLYNMFSFFVVLTLRDGSRKKAQ